VRAAAGRIGRIGRRPAGAALIALTLATAFAGLRLGAHHWKPSSFAVAGDRYANPSAVPRSLVITHGDGYDGQFAYRLGLDPLNQDPTVDGITLDNPPYRQQRIIYPALAWLASSGGDPSLLAIALIGINLAAIAVLGWCGAALARGGGRTPAWGAALGLVPGTAVSLGRDLNEPVALAFAVLGLLAWRRKRVWVAAGLWTLAALTRETTLVVPFAVALTGIWLAPAGSGSALRRRLPGLEAAAVPFIVWAGWQWLLRDWWGRLPVRAGEGNIGMPLAGIVHVVTHLGGGHLLLLELGLVAIVVVGAIAVLPRSAALASERTAFVLAAALALCLTRLVWVDDEAFLRALVETMGLGVVVLLGSRSRLATPALLASSGLWGLVAVLHIRGL
jgi:hypothetical protein